MQSSDAGQRRTSCRVWHPRRSSMACVHWRARDSGYRIRVSGFGCIPGFTRNDSVLLLTPVPNTSRLWSSISTAPSLSSTRAAACGRTGSMPTSRCACRATFSRMVGPTNAHANQRHTPHGHDQARNEMLGNAPAQEVSQSGWRSFWVQGFGQGSGCRVRGFGSRANRGSGALILSETMYSSFVYYKMSIPPQKRQLVI